MPQTPRNCDHKDAWSKGTLLQSGGWKNTPPPLKTQPDRSLKIENTGGSVTTSSEAGVDCYQILVNGRVVLVNGRGVLVNGRGVLVNGQVVTVIMVRAEPNSSMVGGFESGNTPV